MILFLIIPFAYIHFLLAFDFLGKEVSFSMHEEINLPNVLINEIMFDPDPSQGLPPYEYIELYNMDTQPVELKKWKVNDAVIPDYVFPPGTFLILCKAGWGNEFLPFGQTLGINPWDILNNDGQNVVLEDSSGTLIDKIYYYPQLIREEEKKEGGWSIELINPFERCKGIVNWEVSGHPSGGTPGKINSVYSDVPDHSPPIISNHRWTGNNTLQIVFSKPMGVFPGDPTGFFNFIPSLGIIQIQKNEEENYSLLLITGSPIEKGYPYDLSLTGLSDCLGNEMEDTVIHTGIGKDPSFLDLLITELMIDETPSIGLPESEYIEIFNASDQIVELGNSLIITRTDTFAIPGGNVFPGQFTVICPGTRVHLFQEIPNAMGISPFPRLLNEGQVLALFNNDLQLVFSLIYDKNWYRDLEKSNGGYAIEMIDFLNPCGDDKNWCASEDPAGGTPGKPNSVSISNPDRKGPGIRRIYMPDPSKIQVTLTEKIDPSSTASLEILFPGRNDLRLLSFDSLFYDRFALSVSSPLSASTRYEISLRGLRDCVGNTMDPDESRSFFYLSRAAGENDLVINELLFNPRPGGVDWVEIYNKSPDYIDLTGVAICNFNGDLPGIQFPLDPPCQVIPPSGFLVITEDRNQLMADFPHSRPEAISQVNSMPPLPDQFGNIALVSRDQKIMDLFYYISSYHHELITDDEGISLERISYADSTNNPDNWQSASSTAGYGTPTLVNSAHFSAPENHDLVTLQSSIISPDGDGMDDQLNIHYSIGQPGYVGNIEIYDISGHLVKGILKNKLLGTDGTITWDGYSDKGQIPGTGFYILRFEIYNLQGDRRLSKKKFVVTRKF
jgi:hypothetical protein